jgi:hypothetical protein
LESTYPEVIWGSSVRGLLEHCIEKFCFEEDECILAPNYLPEGILLPIKRMKIKIRFYSIDFNNFTPNLHEISSLITNFKIKAILIIHYFGFTFNNLDNIIKLCRKKNIIIMEDCAQALLSKDNLGNYLGFKGDLAFFSLPKFLPVNDGAFILINNPIYNDLLSIKSYRKSFIHNIGAVSNSLSLFFNSILVRFNHGYIFNVLNSFSKVFYFFYYLSICYQINPVNISNKSKERLNNFDFNSFISARHKNIKLIYDNLKNTNYIFLFPYHKEILLPGVPIIIRGNKTNIKEYAKNNNIELLTYKRRWYAFSTTKFLDNKEIMPSPEIVLVPVSENLTENNMLNICRILNHFNNEFIS